jgi:hypothetical protein
VSIVWNTELDLGNGATVAIEASADHVALRASAASVVFAEISMSHESALEVCGGLAVGVSKGFAAKQAARGDA